MRTIRPLYGQRSKQAGIGPWLAFAAAVFGGIAVWTGLSMTVTAGLVVPMVATLSFLFAAALAVVAWSRAGENPAGVTYADVAGAITLIGLCIAATIEPEQMARIVARDSTQP
jgi:hypothetical protein